MKIKILLITLFIIISDLSFAETYKWIDEKGVIHFTDNLTQIPEKYRSQVEKIELQEEKAVIEKGVVTPPKKREDIPRDQLGRGEEYWRGLVENWKMKLKISQDKYEALRMKYNELTEQYNLSKNSVERSNLRRERSQIKNEMDQHQMKIEEAKNMLEKKIPEEAENYRAKPEWVKP